jgi:hypothetical protein
MQQYEADTWYDQNGAIVFTNSLGMPGVGLSRKGTGRGLSRIKGWEDIRDSSEPYLHTIVDQSSDTGDVEIQFRFFPPYRTSPRVDSYKKAWAKFHALLGGV